MERRQSTIPPAILEKNNEAVSLIEAGEFEAAYVMLADALRALRSDPMDDQNFPYPSNSILSVDMWMASPDEVLENRLPENATDAFFVCNHAISIPTNFFQDNTSGFCPVDSTAAVASAMFFNQALAFHLSYIQQSLSSQSSSDSNTNHDKSRMESLKQATDLYRIAIQSSQHMRNSISLDLSRKVNSNFFLAAINNLAVSDRVQLILRQRQGRTSISSTVPRNQPNVSLNRYFESLQNCLSLHRPERRNTPEEDLWNRYLSNVLKGNNMLQPTFCASAG
jgi:hypothetical protein